VQLALGATRSHAPTLLGVRLVQPGGRSMDASASDVAAVLLGALEARGQRCHGGAAQEHNLVDGKLARRGVSLAMMLRDAGTAEGATARVTTQVDSKACDLAKGMASSSGPQAAQARDRASARAPLTCLSRAQAWRRRHGRLGACCGIFACRAGARRTARAARGRASSTRCGT
jgi:hypothetical protein